MGRRKVGDATRATLAPSPSGLLNRADLGGRTLLVPQRDLLRVKALDTHDNQEKPDEQTDSLNQKLTLSPRNITP